MSRIEAWYLVETAYPLEAAAEVLAGEQSSGTFLRVPGETDELRERSGARIESIERLEEVAEPSLPGAGKPAGTRGWQRARICVSWPLANLGPSLPNLMATVAGNLFELKQFSGLRLLDLKLPSEFADAYAGPQFGVEGTRRLAGVPRLPLIGTIIKPSVGLSAAETAATVKQLAEAGIDFIKDDELQADGPHCRFADRAAAVMRVLRDNASRTGKMVMYAFNVTGDIDEMRYRHDLVAEQGGTCVMASIHSIGLAGLVALRRHSQLPIHAHRNGWGMYHRHPMLGVSYVAWQKFWRLAGADQMHVNGLRNKFCEDDASVLASARECLAPMFDPPAKGCEVMPVFSSGQTALQAPGTLLGLGSMDLIYACGGGLMGHPGGIAAGVDAIREAWEAADSGVSLQDYSRSHEALRQAMDAFSR